MSILGILLHNFFILLADYPPKNTKESKKKPAQIHREMTGLEKRSHKPTERTYESRNLKQARHICRGC